MPSKLTVSLFLSALIVFQSPAIIRSSGFPSSLPAELRRQIGPNDSVLLADPNGHLILCKNEDQKRVPASTLKVLTALAAFHHLGPSYRYPTEFYTDNRQQLIIKGFGDPLLISEEVEAICIELSKRLKRITAVLIDDRYFSQAVRIPGRTSSLEPYDAPNGALCVNFNTVFFKTENDTLVSGEPQTPLLPLAVSRIRKAGMSKGRITLSHDQGDICTYAGEMFSFFLGKHGVALSDQSPAARAKPSEAPSMLVYRHESRFTLESVVHKLLEFSNNFIANQLVLTLGAACRSAPGTVSKGMAVLEAYSAIHLGIEDIDIVEGSGISRLNRIRATDMLKMLIAFKPYYSLFKVKERQYFKTGTLSGIRTRVGYFDLHGDGKSLYPFVIFMNTKGKRTERVAAFLESLLRDAG